MTTGAWLQAVALGLSLASVLLLWLGQPFRPASVAREGVGVFSRDVTAVVERASAGLSQRAATGLLVLSLSTQLAVIAWGSAGGDEITGATIAGVVVLTAAVTLIVWFLARGLILSQRLVRIAENPPTNEISPLRFLFEMDLERRGKPQQAPPASEELVRAGLAPRYRFARGFAALRD
jgi:hypothetical protein